MKKTGSKRGSGYDTGPGSAVLDAPENGYARNADGSYGRNTDASYAPETESRGGWKGRGPAPAGALQRRYGKGGYAGDDYDEPGSGYGVGHEAADEAEYVPRRGPFRLRWRGLPRSVAGRIVFGVGGFVVLGAVVVVLACVRSYMLHDPRFMVGTSDDIQIVGAQHLTRDQVLSVFGADLERNIFRAPLTERQVDLERLPWVERATVMRLLPHTIRVRITERTPVAFVRQGTEIGLVDAGGVLLDMPADAAGDPQYSFPVLTGLSENQPLKARAERMQVYQQFMAELGSAGRQVTDSLSEVDVSDPEDVKALISSGSLDILVHFGNEDFLKRYHEFEQNLPEWRQQYPKLASADMRYEGQIVLEMQESGANAPVSAAGNAAVTTNASTGVLPVRAAQGDGEKQATATTTAKATTNTGVLRSAQDDGEKQATAKATTKATADSSAALRNDNKKGKDNSNDRSRSFAALRMTTKGRVENPSTAKTPPMAKTPAKANASAAAGVAKKLAGVRMPPAKTSVVKKAAVKRLGTKRPAAKRTVVGKKKAAALGMSAANQKVFAALAAAHKAALAKAAKSHGATL